ncbi:hypothetical protein ABIB90_007152 [Bradyrhizobium sp. JR4.1]
MSDRPLWSSPMSHQTNKLQGLSVRANDPVTDFHEDPAPVLSIRKHPFVLDKGHRRSHAGRRIWLEAGKLDQAEAEVST